MDQTIEIEVFKTSVASFEEANQVKAILMTRFPDLKVNFDLEDCDKILRVESAGELCRECIMEMVRMNKHDIRILE